jgi:hypothetical protein
MNLGCPGLAGFIALLLLAGPAQADTVAARCELQPRNAALPRLALPCSFSQRQGFVRIERADGVGHEFKPQGAPGRFVDAAGHTVLRTRGLGARGQVYRLTDATLRVLWSTGATALPAALPVVAAPSGPYDHTLSLQGISFRVQALNDGAPGRLLITPAGLKIDNAPLERPIQGRVLGAEVADLNADGSPELYVYLSASVPGQAGPLVGVAANARQSLSDISLPPLDGVPAASRGYQGQDQFAVLEGVLGRRFPIYRDGDPADAPSGGLRQLQYRLHRGEASWVLRLDRLTEF